MTYTILILTKTSSQWLTLPREKRDLFVQTELLPIFAKFAKTCSVKLYDSDFSNAHISDFVIIETENLEEYGHLMGYLRESKTFSIPYFEVKDIIIGTPNNFRGSLSVSDIQN
jgi:mRNA-degrading endonuclease RelE of RelBE toxin-antitoxin system